MRLKNSPRVTQAHHARLGKVLAVQRDEDVILPAAIDMQVALQVALLPEAGLPGMNVAVTRCSPTRCMA